MKLTAVRYRAEVRRGSGLALEATHHVTVIGWDESSEQTQKAATGSIVSEHDWKTCIRSGSKPFQALPLIERGHADRFGLNTRELAIMCASHSGSRQHVETVRGILKKIGAEEKDLLCGFHHPYDLEMSAYTHSHPEDHSAVYNNCSGKHSGMLALAVAEGWPIKDYVEFEHPVQRACVRAIAEVCGETGEPPLVVDGCSAANPTLLLSAMARGFYRFAKAASDSSSVRERSLARIRQAMAGHPRLVAGEGRLDTDLMAKSGGELVAKTGAEGIQCVAIPSRGVGLVVKQHDGGERAKAPALMEFLDANELLSSATASRLGRWRRPRLTNHRGKVVGEVKLELEPVPAQAS